MRGHAIGRRLSGRAGAGLPWVGLHIFRGFMGKLPERPARLGRVAVRALQARLRP